MMFSKVISNVLTAWCPIDAKLALVHTVADPIEAHVNGFGADLFDGAVHDAAGGCIVCFHRCRRLWVPHFLEGLADDGPFFGVEEECADFGFGGGGHDTPNHFGKAQNGAVEQGWFAREIA